MSLNDVIGGTLPKRALLVTFDDAYRSVLDVGAPILRERGIRPVFSVTTAPVFDGEMVLDNLLSHACSEGAGAVLLEAFGDALGTAMANGRTTAIRNFSAGGQIALRDRLAAALGGTPREWGQQCGLYLKPADLRSLTAAGFDFGGHTRHHVYTRQIRAEEMGMETTASMQQIAAATGQPVRVFSFPYGSTADATPKMLEHLRAHGVERFFYTRGRLNSKPVGEHIFRSAADGVQPHSLAGELEVITRLRSVRARVAARPFLEGGGG